MEYVNTKEARRLLGITAGTLRRWDKEGKIDAVRAPSGVRLYNRQCILNITCQKGDIHQKKRVAYCRVSSKKQADDLERQKEFYRSDYPNHELVEDIGSGINFKRKGLLRILELSMRGELEEVVVSHRDRLCRFAFELVEWVFNKNNTKLVVLDKTDHKSSSEELSEDVLSIIHVFSCREMGKRRYKSNKSKTKSDDTAGTNIEEVGRDCEICV
jgi:putative resolvase